jgi:hypothetical protein
VSVAADSRMGKSLRRSAFVQTAHEVRECLYDLMPYWQAAGTPGLHQVEGQTFLVSEAALFLRLLLAPPDAQPHELRAEQYRWAFRLTTMPRQRDLLIRQVFDEESWFSDAELQAIFISIMSSQLTDVPSPAEVLLGLIQRNFPIELDNPVRERLIQIFRGIGES